MNKDESLTSRQQWQIEGYKALMQYGCQMSEDHLNYDKIMMPLSFVPAYFVLTSSDIKQAHWGIQLVVWGAGILLLLYSHFRNWRSRERLYKLWETISRIEACHGFHAFSIVHDYMKQSRALRDFRIKQIFFGLQYQDMSLCCTL